MPPTHVFLSALAAVAATAFGASAAHGPSPGDEIARGAYLARMGDCVSCHSSPDSGPYGGGLKIATPFGYLITPNITFDPATGIGGWTKDDFWGALHDGRRKGGQYLFPVMPFTFTTRATRADSDAIYAYLASVAQVVYPVDINHLDFPFSVRATMLAWNELFFTPGSYVADPTRSAAWNRGAYIVEGLGHCGACHEPRNLMGAVERSAGMTGAKVGDWFATNLTPNPETGLGTWSVDQVVAFLKTGGNARMVAEGPMAEVVHNSLQYMTDDDLSAVAEYLKSLAAGRSTASEPGPVAVPKPRAAALYADNCGPCHGAQGAGGPPTLGPPLRGNPMVVAPDPTDIVRATVAGLAGHAGHVAMPDVLSGVTASQMADIINYVRTSWGNKAAPDVTPAMIFSMQAATAPQ